MPHNFKTLREASNYLNRNNYNNGAIFIGNGNIPINKRKYNIDLPNITVTPQKYDSSFDGSLENFINTTNAMTGGAINRLSPTQNARIIYDAYKYLKGDLSREDLQNSIIFGNNGVVSNNYAEKNPIRSSLINLGGDILGGIGILKNKSIYNLVDRGFIPKKMFLNQAESPNTLTRYVGTGDIGYKDALVSGIIRGNMNPPRLNAHQANKFIKQYRGKVSNKTLREYVSGNLSEKGFKELRRIMPKDETSSNQRFNLKRKSYLDENTYDEYLANRQKEADIFKLNLELHKRIPNRYSNPQSNELAKNWAGNNMATFVYPNEVLANDIMFPGDYAVQIRNANKWAREATDFGHFDFHPTTVRPLEYNHPDVTWYKLQRGLFSRKPYMRKLSNTKVESDRLRYLNNNN